MNKYTTVTGTFTLEQLLGFKTIPQLKEIAFSLGYRIKSTERKPSIITFLNTTLLENPEYLIRAAFHYELKAFLEVIEGNMTLDYARKSGLLYELNRFGLMYVVRYPNGDRKLLFESEMAKRLRPLIPSELERREKDGSLLIEKVALGCSNLYGYIDLLNLIQYFPKIEKETEHSYDWTSFEKSLSPILGIMNDVGRRENPKPMVSPFASMAGLTPEEIYFTAKEKPKKFDLETILKYGEMPYPVFPLKSAEKIESYIEKYGKPDIAETRHILRNLWIEKQRDNVNSLIQSISDIFIFHSIDQINECLQAVLDFTNQVPFWKLNGHSSEEIGKKEIEDMRRTGTMPNIVPGPNLRARGIHTFEQLMEMAENDEEFPPEKPFHKVGRNDPCPCGSGKKFKHCCGR